MVLRLVEVGPKDYQDLSLRVMNLITRDLGKSDKWASDRHENLCSQTNCNSLGSTYTSL
jgi:hypothetical protein